MPRMRWTADLHLLFVQVVMYFGGEKIATPKKIMKLMGGRGLTLSQVKSHLQMYRNKKKEESSKENRMMQEIIERQSQEYIQICERARDNVILIQNQQRLKRNIDQRITAFLESSNITMRSSSNSLYQSSKVGENGNGENGVVVSGDGANDPSKSTGVLIGEEKLSLELTLGLKY